MTTSGPAVKRDESMSSRQRQSKRIGRSVALVLAALLLVLLVGPFLVPVPPLTDTVPPEQLADPDSRFADLADIRVHYKVAGQGEPAMILLHGFGASVFSWREVIAPLSEMGITLAFDRPAFGLTERPLRADWKDRNPYSPEFQVDLTIGLIDLLDAEQAILIGHSAGGTIATLTALGHPDRVRALILVDAAIYTGGGALAWVRPLLRTPQMRRLGPLIVRRIRTWGLDFIRSSWHDPLQITDEIFEGYQKPLQSQDWDKGLWELTAASSAPQLAGRLGSLAMPVLVLTGDDDRIVPTEQSIRLARELPNAELVVIPNCGHLPHEEQPDAFLQAVTAFIEKEAR